MREQLDNYYLRLSEPTQGCLLAIRDHILAYDPQITEAWKYQAPFFCYRGKIIVYFWLAAKTQQPYLGLVNGKHINHPQLQADGRARIRVLPLDPEGELPRDTLDFVLRESIALRR
jgi:hypothetical protein